MNNNTRVTGLDNELFVDANDHSSMGSVDSDMEIVEETPLVQPAYPSSVLVNTMISLFCGNRRARFFRSLRMKIVGSLLVFTRASPNEENRRVLWEDLISIANNMNDAWLVAGDFNDIASIGEKKGGAAVSMRKCNKFQDRITACNLLDLGAMGHKFTWRGPIYHGGQRIYERLDRALGNESWRLKFPDGCVKVLARLDFSDHHPLLITPKNVPHPVAPRQFRFDSAWLMDNG
ncbi:hypothetical protein A2U01_0007281 [Trifolium medium]|uniref:Endonuclease/exonuclease/phosphatase domain-containing protein n=1 Tax=Trifolium medium TaxID=97028 RepID=A0A392MJJ6_9FABA|nr:hypothetical protein [Trifolium medium]